MSGKVSKVDIRRLALVISALFLALFIIRELYHTNTEPAMGSARPEKVFKYEALTGFFAQDEAGTDPTKFDNAKQNFGLIDRRYPSDGDSVKPGTQWQRFAGYVGHLNKNSPAGTCYKVLYHGRHGEGYHNVAEAFYGTKAWDDYWSKLDGGEVNGTQLYWVDAHLTETGKGQALDAHAFYAKQISEAGMPAPEVYVVSPMYRCLQTSRLTFDGLDLPKGSEFKPTVKEMAREVMGEHTCDMRSSRTVIAEAFPEYKIEPGFAEQDELWQADHRETHAEHDVRTQSLLDDVFQQHPEAAFISFTTHSGAIASHLRITGHREYRLPTGGLIPVLVKATRLS